MDDCMNECFSKNNSFVAEFLREILEPEETTTTPLSSIFGQNLMINNDSSITTQQHGAQNLTSTPTTYTLSFDKATALLPSGHDPNCSGWKEVSLPKLGNHAATDSLPLSLSRASHGTKKSRSSSETMDHILSERNRRQELTKKFIALSVTIPGLKKTDKVHVLGEAMNYMKQLEERAKELEEDVEKKGIKSVINITRSHIYIEDDTGVFEMNTNEALPDVEARVLGKDVLIKILCVKQMGILVKILSQLEHHHLSISSTNVLPFENTLDITIVAQIDGKYSLIVKNLVKNLRLVTVLKSFDVQQ